MTDQTTEFVPEVPVSAEEERATANGVPKTETRKLPVFECGTCADRGEVAMILESAAGPVRKAIACPDCKNGKLRMSGSDERIASLEQAVRVLKIAAAIAIALAVLIAIGSKLPNPWGEATKVDLTNIGEKP